MISPGTTTLQHTEQCCWWFIWQALPSALLGKMLDALAGDMVQVRLSAPPAEGEVREAGLMAVILQGDSRPTVSASVQCTGDEVHEAEDGLPITQQECSDSVSAVSVQTCHTDYANCFLINNTNSNNMQHTEHTIVSYW